MRIQRKYFRSERNICRIVLQLVKLKHGDLGSSINFQCSFVKNGLQIKNMCYKKNNVFIEPTSESFIKNFLHRGRQKPMRMLIVSSMKLPKLSEVRCEESAYRPGGGGGGMCWLWPQITYRGRVEIGGVYLPSQRIPQLCTPSPGWANFSIMMECTPDSGNCHSACVYSLGVTVNLWIYAKEYKCILYTA
jgi:hypothetical protein